MKVHKAASLSLVAACCLLFAPGAARAEPGAGESGAPTATSQAAAEELFNQGRTLLDEGRYPEACAKLAESQRLDPSAGTLLNLGDCFEKNGQTASAWATFKDAERASFERRRADWEKTAQRRAAALEPRLSRLSVVVPAAALVEGLVIEIEALRVEPALYDTPIPLDPGLHKVRARAPGRVPWSTALTLGKEADRQAVTIPVLAVDALAAKGNAAQPGAGDGAREHGRIPVIAWALGAGAVVLAGTGAVLWGVGQSERSDMSRSCAPTGTCAHDDVVASRTKLIAGDVLVGAGVIALGLGVYFALSGRGHAARIAVSPQGVTAGARF